MSPSGPMFRSPRRAPPPGDADLPTPTIKDTMNRVYDAIQAREATAPAPPALGGPTIEQTMANVYDYLHPEETAGTFGPILSEQAVVNPVPLGLHLSTGTDNADQAAARQFPNLGALPAAWAPAITPEMFGEPPRGPWHTFREEGLGQVVGGVRDAAQSIIDLAVARSASILTACRAYGSQPRCRARLCAT